MTTVATWQDKLCIANPLGYKWLNAEPSSASNPFDRDEIYTIHDLANIVLSRTNITIVYDNNISCGYGDPQLQFTTPRQKL